MKSRIFTSFLLLGLIFLGGCGSTTGTRSMSPVLRAATDTPIAFEAPAGTVFGDDTCLSPLTDPRDGTQIVMHTSFGAGIGDYVVPSGMYGVKDGELLRVNCNTGEVTGIVRR